MFLLLDTESSIGVRLIASDAMWPGSSVSGLYSSRPESASVGVGPICEHQLADYAGRKDLSSDQAKRALSTIAT